MPLMLCVYISAEKNRNHAVSADTLEEDSIDGAIKLLHPFLKQFGRELVHISCVPMNEDEAAAFEQLLATFGRKIFLVLGAQFSQGISFAASGRGSVSVDPESEGITSGSMPELVELEKTIRDMSATFASVLNKTLALGFEFGLRDRENARRIIETN